MHPSRAARAALAAGAAAYALAVLAMSQAPGPRAWALHLPGFLSPTPRFLVMTLLLGGALLLWADLAVIPCKASMFEVRALAKNTAFVRQA